MRPADITITDIFYLRHSLLTKGEDCRVDFPKFHEVTEMAFAEEILPPELEFEPERIGVFSTQTAEDQGNFNRFVGVIRRHFDTLEKVSCMTNQSRYRMIDARIAFLLGQLTNPDYPVNIIITTGSFALAEPMRQLATAAEGSHLTLCSFKSQMEPELLKWAQRYQIDHIDLDELYVVHDSMVPSEYNA